MPQCTCGVALVDPGQTDRQRFLRLSNTDKLGIALRGAVNSLPGEFKHKALELLDPTNLAIMAGALAIWVGSHATPIGWIVDIGMVGLGVVALGAEAVAVIREIQAFAQGVINAQSEADLLAAGRHLGKAVAIVGVDVVVALLLKKALVKVREPNLKAKKGAESEQLLFGKYDPKKAQTKLPPDKPAQNSVLVKGAQPTSPLGRVTGEYSAVKPGPLPDNMAATFSGGRYSAVVLEHDTVLSRAGTKDQPLGQFFSQESPSGVLQTRIDKAVLPEWPGGAKSPIDTVFQIKVPAGTQVYVGEVGSQGGFYVGGTEQIVVSKPWLIEGVEVINASPLK